MSRGHDVVAIADRFYHRMRHPDALRAARGQAPGAEGFARGSISSSYIHLHFGAAPAAATRLLAWAARAP